MQDPVGWAFNPVTMRMELVNFAALVFNPTAQAKFVHTVGAGYVTGSVFVLGISSWYLLRKHACRIRAQVLSHRRRFRAGVGGLRDRPRRRVRLRRDRVAKIENCRNRSHVGVRAGACGPTLAASINEEEQKNDWEIKVPYVLGLIATRSANTQLPGIRDIRALNREPIKSGIEAVSALEAMRRDPHDAAAREQFKAHEKDMGYGLLLRRYYENVRVGHAGDDRARGDGLGAEGRALVLGLPADGRSRIFLPRRWFALFVLFRS